MVYCLACETHKTLNAHRLCDACVKRYYVNDAIREGRKIIALCPVHGYHPLTDAEIKRIYPNKRKAWEQYQITILIPETLTEDNCVSPSLMQTSCATSFLS